MKILKQGKIRTIADEKEVRAIVSDIIDDVRERGDEAVFEYSVKFDGFRPQSAETASPFRVPKETIEEAYKHVIEIEMNDLKRALANLRAFAEAQRGTLTEVRNFQPEPGIFLGDRVIPVDSCLCYVPGGRFPLFSSALMLITPAKVAGVKRICSCSPISPLTGTIEYKTLVAMDMAGADEIYAVGGAQAVAAFAYGTDSIEPVDVIVGPGNKYTAEAKRQVYGQVGIDFVAGPSEVLIIADENADATTVAADMLAQSEHDPNAKAILITTSEDFGRRVSFEIEKELMILRTAHIATPSWNDNGEILIADDIAEAVEYTNKIAPEHLEVNLKGVESIFGAELPDGLEVLKELRNYGSLFIGKYTAEVFGDYASGTNHTLPTVRAARYTGGVWVGMFLKVMTDQYMTAAAAASISPAVNRMAFSEGLEGHAIAASRRFLADEK